MTSKHTPGPWIAKPLYSVNGSADALFWEDRSKPGLHTRRLDDKGAFSHADASLIASAPDLLAALDNLQANPNDPRAHRVAMDAMRKARGEGQS